jgi:NADPH:quinone reductase
VKLSRPTLFKYLTTREEFHEYSDELLSIMSKDKLDVRIHKVFPLKDVAEAHNVGVSSKHRNHKLSPTLGS